ncbi:AAA family ATPase [Colletotrichum scovillei]|uniref:AAA family ATPase n=1 Tax=Colletotrichum scovillei TaxID=1209932 RepID=A0A9P7RAL3_9PEZI|nr:AAA family ATPase [Colletotrichum scovillei]KAG7071407.1 AAA family ATPase [Colletotrichum scovillei]KAG7079658.1 AAA family ATPase [Colletotrichum scovillei]
MPSQPDVSSLPSDGDPEETDRDQKKNPLTDSDWSSDEDLSGSDSDSNDRERKLFISSSIARDETKSQAKQEKGILSNLKNQLPFRRHQLNSTGNVNRLPIPKRRSFPNVSEARRPSPWRPPQPPYRPLPIPPRGTATGNSARSTRDPSRAPPPPPRINPVRYPRFKALKNAKWREQLQTRRKISSEACSEEPNAGSIERMGVDSHRHGSEKDKVADLQTVKEDKSADCKVGLAETLASVTENQLGIDLLDQSKEVSTFISYLLDTIQLLERQARYRHALSPVSVSASSSDSGSNSREEEAAGSQNPGFQVVHRIFCTAEEHEHDEKLYEDEPVTKKDISSGRMQPLKAEDQIFHLDTWLSMRPSLCFLVIKEHRCLQGQREEGWRHRNTTYPGGPSERLERLKIVSPALQKALKQVAEFQIFHESEYDEANAEMEAPYLFLFHHRKKLSALAEVGIHQEVVSPLTKFLKDSYEAEYTEAEEMFLQGHVNAYHINKLFKPNQMLLLKQKGEPQVGFVLSKYTLHRRKDIVLEGWRWKYDGNNLHRVAESGRISMVTEEKTNIRDLDIHPIEFARQEDVKILTERGNQFWSMRGHVYTCYTGWDRESRYRYASARFMVDAATYEIMYGQNSSSSSAPSRYDPWPMKINRRESLPQKAEMLLPATLFGFYLKEKKWVELYVDKTHAVDWNYRAFDRLVLDIKTKEMIRALVDIQTSAKKMDDIIAGKGNGLIILLHGSPGTGKTLTAESVAEIAEKPLYRVTCGDIGTDARDVESYLETVMYLGKTWDCVLLLDEADVFLEERTMADLQRNSLVSVFLRLLEYYEGILILTSNRVGTFDEAFKSRIQVAIHYDNLTKMSRKAIWQNFFDMIEESAEEDANMPELERRLDQLASEEMNGRQIRNALLTARQLAKHRKERLDWEHLSQVIKTSAAFNKYLKTVRGHTDEQWARGESLR